MVATTKKEAWAKKGWYSVVSPEFLGKKVVAETPSSKESDLIGRTVTVPLNEITGNMHHYQTEIRLKISKISGQDALTEYYGQELGRDVLSRIIRKWSSRIDAVQAIETKDGRKLRIKALIISARRVKTSIQSSVRTTVFKIIKNYAKDKSMEEIVLDVNNGKLQKLISDNIKSIYPTRAVEIRRIEVL